MEYLCYIFTFLLFYGSVTVPSVRGVPQYYSTVQDTCVLSLIIPKESIKNNCNNNEGLVAKLQSLESQLRQLTHHVRVIDSQRIQPIMTQFANLETQVGFMKSQLNAAALKNRYLESKYHEMEQKLETLSHSSSVLTPASSDRLLDPIKPLLMEEFQRLKTTLIQNLEKELFQTFSHGFEEAGSTTELEESPVSTENSSLMKVALKGDNSKLKNSDQLNDELISVQSVNINQLARSLQKLTNHKQPGTENLEKRNEPVIFYETKGNIENSSTNGSNNDQVDLFKNSSAEFDVENISSVNISSNGTEYRDIPGNKSQETSSEKPDALSKEISEQLNVIIQSTVYKALEQQQQTFMMAVDNVLDKETFEISLGNITTRVSDLEINLQELQQNMTALYRNQSAVTLSIDQVRGQQIIQLQSAVDSLGRRVDGPQNTLQRTSQLQHELESIKTNIQINLKERLESAMTALRQTVQQQEKKQNASSIYLNIFDKTLKSQKNESQHMFSSLQQEIRSVKNQVRYLNKSQNQNSDLEMRINDLEAELGDIDFTQSAADVKLDRLKENMAQRDREIGTKFRSIQQNLQRIQSRYSGMTNISRSVQILDVKYTTMTQKVAKNELTLKYLYIQRKLESGEWMAYNFSYNSVKNTCNQLQYVRQNRACTGNVGKFVGVILCSEDRYKILLGNSLEDDFLDIADEHGHGQDHCEFVGGTSESDALVDKEFTFFPSTEAYVRAEWGQEPRIGRISPILTPVTGWYECGVNIP